MKRTAMLSLALLFMGTIVLAQQASDWRPSIAEDNRAANWQDTLSFIEGAVNDPAISRSYLSSGNGNPFEQALLTFGASSDEKCSLSFFQLRSIGWSYVERTQSTVNLGLVDPLSIVVSSQPPFEEYPHPIPGFRISMRTRNNQNLVRISSLFKEGGWKTRSHEDEAREISCKPGEKHCTTRQELRNEASLFIRDPEFAHRIARSIMHAALLCGGTKAVSPF